MSLEVNQCTHTLMHFKRLVFGILLICLKLVFFVAYLFKNKRHHVPSRAPTINLSGLTMEVTPLQVESRTVPKVALFDRRICSGLGDRLLAIFSVYTIAVLNNHSLVARWCERGSSEERTYPLAALQMYMTLPSGIKLLADDKYDNYLADVNPNSSAKITYEGHELPATAAYDGIPALAFRTMALDGGVPIDRQLFEHAYYHWTKQIQCNPTCGLPANHSYLVLHIRQGDKTFEHGSQPFVPGAPNEKYCTHEAIKKFTERQLPIYCISDNNELKQSIAQSYPGVVNLASGLGQSQVFCDFCLMINSQGIIQHSPVGWSALSSAAAFAAEIPLLSTWYGTSPHESDPMFNRLYDFGSKGGRPRSAMDCADLALLYDH